ncbi:hypothetical protein JTB14_031041 [Gonioctena quinquepunctata]|nr:hypothetical protein JTB14_031041 [Gonioctena quinquepunctata]
MNPAFRPRTYSNSSCGKLSPIPSEEVCSSRVNSTPETMDTRFQTSTCPAHHLSPTFRPRAYSSGSSSCGELSARRSEELHLANHYNFPTSLSPLEIEDEQIEATLPPPEASDSQETAQIDISIEEREPTDAQNDSAQSPSDGNQIIATPPPPGTHEVERKSASKIQDIEAVLSASSASSGADWNSEVESSPRCYESSDKTDINVSKVLDDTFEDYSSDSDIDQIPTKPVRIESKVACIECEVVSNLKYIITPDKFADFGIGRHRGRRPRAPVPNYVSWSCAVCKLAQDTMLPNDVIKDNVKQIFSHSQKLSQQRNQEHTHYSLPSDGDGRPPVSVTPEDRSDHEDITQQQDGIRDGRPPVPDVKNSRPEDEAQDETQDETPKEGKDAHQVIQKEQSCCQPISPKDNESHSQVLPTPQKDEKGENAHVNIAIEEIAENPLSPKNYHFHDTFRDTSGLPGNFQLPELNVQQDSDLEDKFPYTFITTCSDLPNNQKLPSSYKSGPFLDPQSNAQYETLEKNNQNLMEEQEMAKHNADIYQTQQREYLERQKLENQKYLFMDEPEEMQEHFRNFGESEKPSFLENQFLPTYNLEVDKHFPHVNVSARPRTMEAECTTNPNKHVANIKTHIIREADKHSNTEQPIETNMVPQRIPDDDQGRVKTKSDDPLETLQDLAKRNSERERADFKDKEDDEQMDTEQIQTTIIAHKDVEGEEILHLDRDTIKDITSTLIKDKLILEKRDAERKEFYSKKQTQKAKKQNKQKNAKETPQKKLLGRRASCTITDTPAEEERATLNKNRRTEPHTSERNAPLDVGEYDSSYHLENRLVELQQHILDRALELTDSTLEECQILNPNLKGYDMEKMTKIVRESLYNQNVERLTEENKEELNRLKSKTENNAEFLKSPMKKKKTETPRGSKIPISHIHLERGKNPRFYT